MKKIFYPAIFHKAKEGGFWITFPDIPECITQGDDMQQAYEMAVDALKLAIISREKEGDKIPIPSELCQITLEDDAFYEVIEFGLPV